MKRLGVIGIKGGWSSEKLADAVAEETGERILIETDKLWFDGENEKVYYDDLDLGLFDGLFIKKIGSEYSPNYLDRLEILRFLSERFGIRMFSKPGNIMKLLNRLSCTITLKTAGVPMPPTVITEDINIAKKAVFNFKKAVLKPLFSTKAKGMIVVDTQNTDSDYSVEDSINSFINAGNKVIYIQKMLDIPEKDYSVAFLGGKYLAAYAREKTNNSWNTTTDSGGRYLVHEPCSEMLAIAQKSQELFNLDFTSVDIAKTRDGVFVFEVSAFGGFKGLKSANDIDAAKLYVSYALKELS